MRWIIYNLLFTFGYLLMVPRYLFRMWRRGGYLPHFMQRFGVYPAELIKEIRSIPRIWIHAVSVGEMYVAIAFLQELRRRMPDMGFVVTTNTSTAHKVAEDKLDKRDVLLYFPVDLPLIVRRVVSVIRPHALLLTECELWPNLVRRIAHERVPVVLLNGRISASSFRGYRLIRFFLTPILQSISLFLAQSEEDARRLRELGADPARIRVTGSAKFDLSSVDAAGMEHAREILDKAGMKGATILLGGSTWPGEERVLLNLFGKIKKDMNGLKLVLVPRHVERCGAVEEDIRTAGFSYIRRSRIADAPAGNPDVLLVDTTGELKHFYTAAELIFVGKSLCERGGQNLIEPAACAKAVVVGPYMGNFQSVTDDFLSAGALVQVRDEAELESEMIRLLRDDSGRRAIGEKAGRLVAQRRGVIPRNAEDIVRLLNIQKRS